MCQLCVDQFQTLKGSTVCVPHCLGCIYMLCLCVFIVSVHLINRAQGTNGRARSKRFSVLSIYIYIENGPANSLGNLLMCCGLYSGQRTFKRLNKMLVSFLLRPGISRRVYRLMANTTFWGPGRQLSGIQFLPSYHPWKTPFLIELFNALRCEIRRCELK